VFVHNTVRYILQCDDISSVSTENYHKFSDETMEALFERLEEALDVDHQLGYEVDYSVCEANLVWPDINTLNNLTERSAHIKSKNTWNICHKQAAAQQTDLAVFSC
jgi:hypothetical protein